MSKVTKLTESLKARLGESVASKIVGINVASEIIADLVDEELKAAHIKFTRNKAGDDIVYRFNPEPFSKFKLLADKLVANDFVIVGLSSFVTVDDEVVIFQNGAWRQV